MDVRCTGCNKLFRVADEKIVGSGVKFTCTRCHGIVKITKGDFEQYRLTNNSTIVPETAPQKPAMAVATPTVAEAAATPVAAAPAPASAPTPTPSFLLEEPAAAPSAEFPASSFDASLFDMSDPASAAASLSQQVQEEEREGEIPGLFAELPPAPQPAKIELEKPEELPKQPSAPAPEPPAKPAATAEPFVDKKPKPGVMSAPGSPKVEPKPVSKPVPAATQKVEPKPASRPEPARTVKPEVKPAAPGSKEEVKATPKARPETARPSAPVQETAVPSLPIEVEEDRTPAVFDAAPAAGSGFGKKALIAAAVLLLIGGAVFGIISYMGRESGQNPQTTSTILSPDGLQLLNPSGSFDSSKGDLVITGTVQNTTDKPKPAWYVVVEVFDAQSAVIAKARLLSGKQLYTKRDIEILLKRGAAVQDLKMKSLEQGITIPPKGSANFEIRILEAPTGVASFNPVLQPFDPVQLFKELAEEQK